VRISYFLIPQHLHNLDQVYRQGFIIGFLSIAFAVGREFGGTAIWVNSLFMIDAVIFLIRDGYAKCAESLRE
jgi:hypothetical protein